MTDPTRPDDGALERYLRGEGALSRRYRDASRETTPPALDALVLAQAQAEARRRRRARPVLATVALAASLVLGVNLAWNVWQAEDAVPVPLERKATAPDVFAPDPPATGSAPAAAPPSAPAPRAERAPEPTADAAAAAQEQRAAKSEALLQERDALARRRAESRAQGERQAAAPAPLAAVAPDAPARWTEAEKIERLIRFVAGLDDVDFVRNGDEHSAEDAARHLRLKLEKAGDRVRTADDFIRLCASKSSVTGEPYLLRFPDGRTRTAEEVLREQLATMP